MTPKLKPLRYAVMQPAGQNLSGYETVKFCSTKKEAKKYLGGNREIWPFEQYQSWYDARVAIFYAGALK